MGLLLYGKRTIYTNPTNSSQTLDYRNPNPNPILLTVGIGKFLANLRRKKLLQCRAQAIGLFLEEPVVASAVPLTDTCSERYEGTDSRLHTDQIRSIIPISV